MNPNQQSDQHPPIPPQFSGRPMPSTPGPASPATDRQFQPAPVHSAFQPAPTDRQQPVDPAIETWHRESLARYPELRLSAGEYVIEAVRRHPIGLASIWLFVFLIAVIVFALIPLYGFNLEGIAHTLRVSPDSLPSPALMAVPALFLLVLCVLGGLVATYVYLGNRFYLTNESVIQHVKTSLFNNKTQMIGLINVEDVSCEQNGVVQQLFGYGTIRLSTQGEETIYHFYYVTNPQKVVNDINDAVESFVHRVGSTRHNMAE